MENELHDPTSRNEQLGGEPIGVPFFLGLLLGHHVDIDFFGVAEHVMTQFMSGGEPLTAEGLRPIEVQEPDLGSLVPHVDSINLRVRA